MGLPANIRVNAAFPFPALVQGSGPVTVAKNNGIWTIGHSITNVANQLPPPANYPTDYILFWDNQAKTFFNMTLAQLVAVTSLPAGARTQRSALTTPIGVAAGDQIINCNIPTPAACALPAAATRNGAPLTINDLGQATANPITITPNGTEKIDGAANYVLRNNLAWVTLMPFNDGVNTGWKLQ